MLQPEVGNHSRFDSQAVQFTKVHKLRIWACRLNRRLPDINQRSGCPLLLLLLLLLSLLLCVVMWLHATLTG
jgi:hypothetical protein